jgi:hypothetical protein
MEYQANGVSRLEESRKIALRLMDQMADTSRIVVLDAGDSPETQGDAAAPRNQARTRIKGLSFRPINSTMNAQLPRAYRALKKLATTDPSLPRLLYVFSDRTRASWTADRKVGDAPKDVRSFFVDVGVEEPHDLAIDGVDVNPIVAESGHEVDVRVTVRATGGKHRTQLACVMSHVGADSAEQRIVRDVEIAGGQTEVFAFKYTAPPADSSGIAACQITAKFETADSLPFNNTRTATFIVRPRRRILTIAERPLEADSWKFLFASLEKERDRPLHTTFQCEIEAADAVGKGWTPQGGKRDPLSTYQVVCLFQTAQPDQRLWKRLKNYVEGGGNLIIVPPSEEDRESLITFNREGETLLPATLVKLVDAPNEPQGKVFFQAFDARHPLTRWFVEGEKSWGPIFTDRDVRPFFRRYWEVKPHDKNETGVIIRYDDRGEGGRPRPALVERGVGRGRVLLFTIPLDYRWAANLDKSTLDRDKRPLEDRTNIWKVQTGFGVVLVDRVCQYLTGEVSADDVNFVCGHPVEVPLLNQDNSKQYQLKGPVGLTLSETKVPAPGAGRRLVTVPQATHPGNYELKGEGDRIAAAFSVTTPPEESRLERVPPEMIEATLGEGALLPPGKAPRLQDAITDRQPGEIELLPWLLLVVLLVLAVESVLANKFYKRDAAPTEGTGVAVPQRGPAREDAPAQASVS